MTGCFWLVRTEVFRGEYFQALRDLASLAILAALVFVAVTLPHELGHFAAGKLAGMRFGFLWVLGIGLIHRRTGWSLSVSMKNPHFGCCMMYPTDARDLRRRYLVGLAGGPILGLAGVAVCAALYLGLRIPAHSVPGRFLTASIAAGLLTDLLSLWPDWPGPIRSDAYWMRVLLRGGPGADRHIAMITVSRLETSGWRYDEMDVRLLPNLTLTEPDTPLDSQREAGCLFHAYHWNLSLGRPAQALPLLEQWEALSQSSSRRADLSAAAQEESRRFFALERAFLAARHNHDVAAAQTYLASVPDSLPPKALRLRAEAALLLAQGLRNPARLAAERGLELTPALERADLSISRIVLRDLRSLHALAMAG